MLGLPTEGWIAFDCKLRRPGCVNIQALFQCDSRLAHIFPTETWVLYPSEDMHVYPYTPEILNKLLALVLEDLAMKKK